MKPDIIELLTCPECSDHPLRYEAFETSDGHEIEHGVVWCSTCEHWYPIEEGLLELLVDALSYADDRARFWATHAPHLKALGLRPPDVEGNRPDVKAQRQQQAHFDWYADNSRQTYSAYEQTPFWQGADALAFDEWRKEILPGGYLLDVGCAQGRSTFKIMDREVRVVAFDISKALIRQAIARCRKEKKQASATFFVADASRFPFITACFDYVLVYGVLHHVPDPSSTCQEIARVLKPGGMYLGSENNRTIFRAAFDLLQRIRPLWHEEAGAQPLLSRSDYEKWLPQSDFDLSIKTSVFLPPHLFNYLTPESARRLLGFTDALFGSIPYVNEHGGLILVRGVRRSNG